MNNSDLINATKDIVISMINSKLINANSQDKVNENVIKSIDAIYQKLVELNSKEEFIVQK